MRRTAAFLTVLLLGAGVLGAALARSEDASSGVRDGGRFDVALVGGTFEYIDPARAGSVSEWALLDPTCARLMRYPDKPPPEVFHVVPEVAADYPGVSNNAKTFTFRLRRDFTFSNGDPVTARAFATAINRTLAPGVETEATAYTQDIVGAEAVRDGSQPSAKGVVTPGKYRLVITLKYPTPDFPARMTMMWFCAVPPKTPSDPEGIKTPLPAAGPYYVAEYVPGRKVVLKRNTHYDGTRPHHVESFVADLSSTTPEDVIGRVESGKADWGLAGPAGVYFNAGLHKKYGINHRRFFVKPGLNLRAFAFNTSRGLFRDARLRRAVNFAIDRAEIRRITPGGPLVSTLTDQYLPPSFPHFQNADIYPLKGPILRRARELAGKRLTGRKVVIYMRPPSDPPYRFGQALRRNLEKLGLKVEVRQISIFDQIEPGGPWDLAYFGWLPAYRDPFTYLNVMFHGRFVGTSNFSGFNQPPYNRLLEDAARRRGIARERAYANLDVQLARDAAPIVPIDFLKEATFVSKRVDPRCRVLRPALDLVAVCLKR